ncbi:MAG: Asp-tRNA(Asn)/Glu-tRNA(Gln) amidotransferase subunit GatB [Actinomycetales bacterium]
MTTTTTPALVDYDDLVTRYDPVLGLEVHVELSTASKMFCGCATTFGAAPNSQVCPVCLALPGALPVVNGTAVESAIRIGLALGCSIAATCRFARKNYFYPDMPKNFQTSQYDEPIAFDGQVEIEVPASDEGPAFTFTVPIERAHMEEDTGKSLHVGGATGRIHGAEYSLVDYNRAGIPLIEIVTKPIEGAGRRAPEVARAFVATLRDLLRGLDVSDVRMEQGSLRCDANVSLRTKVGDDPSAAAQHEVPLGIRSETKNVNSLRSVERAIRYEMTRHAGVLDAGGRVTQETRHWHEDTGITTAGRSKEEAEDYRYFPEPDLVPIECSADWVEQLRGTIPMSPAERRAGWQQAWGLSDLELRDVVNAGAGDLIEASVAAGATPAAARKWWMGELSRHAKTAGVALDDLSIDAAQVAQLSGLVAEGRLNDSLARQVIEAVLAGEGDPAEVMTARGLELVSDDGALAEAVDAVIAANPDIVAKIQDGKAAAAGALIGQVMKRMAGKADAGAVRAMIAERIPTP